MFNIKLNKISIAILFTAFVIGGIFSATFFRNDFKAQARINEIGVFKIELASNNSSDKFISNSTPSKLCLTATCKIAGNANVFNLSRLAYVALDNRIFPGAIINDERSRYFKIKINFETYGYHDGFFQDKIDQSGHRYSSLIAAKTRRQEDVSFLKMQTAYGVSGDEDGLKIAELEIGNKSQRFSL
jgi:hypothetical protein